MTQLQPWAVWTVPSGSGSCKGFALTAKNKERKTTENNEKRAIRRRLKGASGGAGATEIE